MNSILSYILWIVCVVSVAVIGVLMIFEVFENIKMPFSWMVVNLWYYWAPALVLFCFACYITWLL